MHGMGPPPEIIWRQCQHADDAADPVIGEPVTEECAMTAIVLDHEQPDQKSRGRNGQQQIESVSDVERKHHQYPKKNERHDRNQNLDDAAPVTWFAVARKRLQQGAWIGPVNRVGAALRSVAQDVLLRSNVLPLKQHSAGTLS